MDLLKNWFGKKGIQVINTETWETKKLGNLVMPESIDNRNAFILANSVPELFIPIDFYADRISKLRFFIAKENGKEMANTLIVSALFFVIFAINLLIMKLSCERIKHRLHM